MSGRRHLAALALAAALAVPALSACQDEEPRPRLPEETPSSAEPTPTEAETTEAAEETPEEFLRGWIAEIDRMQVSGDSSGYRGMIDDCETCAQFADRVDAIYESGGWIKTDGAEVTRIERFAGGARKGTYDVSFVAAPIRFREAADTEVQRLPGGEETFRVTITEPSDGWRVRNYTVVVD